MTVVPDEGIDVNAPLSDDELERTLAAARQLAAGTGPSAAWARSFLRLHAMGLPEPCSPGRHVISAGRVLCKCGGVSVVEADRRGDELVVNVYKEVG